MFKKAHITFYLIILQFKNILKSPVLSQKEVKSIIIITNFLDGSASVQDLMKKTQKIHLNYVLLDIISIESTMIKSTSK